MIGCRSGNRRRAASASSSIASRADCQRGAHAERRLRGDALGELDGARQLAARLDDLLHQADAVRLVGAELVAGEQPAHRVAPAELARQADGGAADGIDAALTSICPKRVSRAATRTSVASMSSMPMVKQMPCTAATTGLPRRRPCRPNGSMMSSLDRHAPAREDGRPLGEIEPAREVVAVREEDAGAQLVVAVELGLGAADGA